MKKCIQNTYRLERQDRMEIEGEFSTQCLCAFIPRPGSKLEKDQEEWLEEHKDKLEEEEMEGEAEKRTEDRLEEDMVGTPLFTEGEHGVVDKEPVGQEGEIT
jgi:hypothetical protein